ncbi:MAG: hypothetical protein JOZ37_16225 [Actinobacteria bacterium]|nr:hypothetical protein [Actinomycetota bacterium]MBV9665516.1 hypothetical protein [Actinomycetota bacterium]MBV9934670.1 hypothetical protein [Actinomycetota bacterium]
MWIDDVGCGQYGIVTWDQGVEHVGIDAFKRLIKAGRVRRHRSGIYVAAGVPASWETDVLSACFASGGVAGIKSAARLKGFPYVPSIVPEILVADGRHPRMDGVRLHRTNFLPAHHIEVVRGIPATVPARTMVDLSAGLGDETLWRVLNEAERLRLFTFKQVATCLDEMQARGRRRIAHLRPLLDLCLEGPNGDSDPEIRTVRWLLDGGIRRPQQQYWVVVNGQRYCIDAVWLPEKVGLEWDGWDAHRMRMRFDGDRDKIGELEIAGWLIIPVTSAMSRETVVGKVRRALTARSTFDR